ncbi:MAG TPA: thiamine diphosphokinase [Acidimicrobiales bacterium]|jgi:thiamine pyrophosphokinase|nr:thiamine diphosphokinase [Acidimicrobiales bacterium]
MRDRIVASGQAGRMQPAEPDADRTVVVVAGGSEPPASGVQAALPTAPALVIAADSGLAHAKLLGLAVDLVVGDLDSVDAAALERAVATGTRVERHPAAKDKTDLELALDVAVRDGGAGSRIVVVTSVGGRLDHGVANLLVLASPRYRDVRIDAFVDAWAVAVVRAGSRRLEARVGRLVTLLPVGGEAVGVTTSGLLYPLADETLHVGSSRGVSNVAQAVAFTVTVREGTVLAIREWAD